MLIKRSMAAALPPHRLLVVDDERPILFALGGYFSAQGFVVDAAHDLEEARSLISRFQYALVITDLRMSGTMGTEGLELVTLLRARPQAPRIMLLTGYGSPEIELEALTRGVDVFLEKPIPLPQIAAIAAQLLSTAGEHRR